MNSTLRITEKRREPRRPARGAVVVRLPGSRQDQIRGQLVDVSSSGFRVLHQSSSLEAGQVVEFEFHGSAGTARVIWNRIDTAGVQTGFLIL